MPDKCFQIGQTPVLFLGLHMALMQAVRENLKSKEKLVEAIKSSTKSLEQLKTSKIEGES